MKDATHITLVIDRSGSMNMVKEDAEGAINAFISEQKLVEGECTLVLYDFDAPRPKENDDWLNLRYNGPITNAHHYHLMPRGNTALLDAVALSIIDTGKFLSGLPEDERPDKVIFVIQTDGQENSSTKYSWEQVRDSIKKQSEQYNWQFIFLGMGQDSWNGGTALGIQNIVRSADSGIAHSHTHSYLSANTTMYRGGHVHTMDAMADVAVAASGKITNQAGEEIDPITGKVIDQPQA
jgi:hypothetical protein